MCRPLLAFVCSGGHFISKHLFTFLSLKQIQDFPGGPGVGNASANAGDMGLIPGPGRFHMLRSN